MKKYILVFSFACFLVLGAQNAFAQNATVNQVTVAHNLENSAKENTVKVIKTLERTEKLSSGQQSKIFDTFEAVEKKVKGINQDGISMTASMKSEIQAFINQNLKKILTDKQYNLYVEKMAAN